MVLLQQKSYCLKYAINTFHHPNGTIHPQTMFLGIFLYITNKTNSTKNQRGCMLACNAMLFFRRIWRIAKQRAEKLRSNGKAQRAETRADLSYKTELEVLQ